MSTASNIALKLHSRISNIRVANGFNTDIGQKVLRGRMTFDAAYIPLTVMVEGEDTPRQQKYADVEMEQRYIFEGHLDLDESEIENPNDKAHLIIADLKKAIFGSDLTLDGLLKDKNAVKYIGRAMLAREEGQARVAASIEISITYYENLAQP